MQALDNEVIDSVITGTAEGGTLRGGSGNEEISGEGGDDVLLGRGGADVLFGGEGADTLRGGSGNDVLLGGSGEDQMAGGSGADLMDGGEGNDLMSGGEGNDILKGGAGDDQMRGGRGEDLLLGGAGNDLLKGGRGNDMLYGGDGDDTLRGGSGDDKLEGGAGNDVLSGGGGNDWLLGFSWGGEPVPAQDADGQVNADEPVEDFDTMRGGKGADTFEFRWLLDAKDEIVAKHTDENGDIDYSGNGIAGENDNVHDHWVEHIGTKVVEDFREGQGDTLVFAGHTVNLDTVTHTDWNSDGRTDTVLTFVSNQGGNGGAHDGDEVGTVVILNNVIDTVDVDAGVFYGVEEPWSAAG